METNTPQSVRDPFVYVPKYEAATFACECGEQIIDIPMSNQWDDGHEFECEYCGRAYALSLTKVQDATNEYPSCPDCGDVFHHEWTRLICRTCDYNIPDDAETEREMRLEILVQATVKYVRDTRMTTEPPMYYPTEDDMDLHDILRERIDPDSPDTLSPDDDWFAQQVQNLLDDGVLEDIKNSE